MLVLHTTNTEILYMHADYINPDGQTGFGTPWEIMFRGNYTVRTKGGNINGYSALFSFIPELHLGKLYSSLLYTLILY